MGALAFDQGYGNTAVGHQALFSNVYGDYNTAIGQFSLQKHGSNSQGDGNTVVGNSAGKDLSGARYNTAIGYKALSANSSSYIGEGNVAAGYMTLFNNDASFNAAFWCTCNGNQHNGYS